MKKMKTWAVSIAAVAAVGMASTAMAGSAAAGKEKSMLCMGCHGENGISVSPDIPNLAGQKEVYLQNALKDYQTEIRKNPIMSSMAAGLSPEDITDLAAYYASLK